jgi:5-methylcytosine-specific restriction endonuclease McrBC GTP-binding regulatory subunit McrB
VSTEQQVKKVVEACLSYGGRSIIALAGPPASGKSHVALIAAQRAAGEPTRVKEVQFHAAFTYEEFVEGLRIDNTGAVIEKPGVFMEWNEAAAADPNGDHRYVLLIEELTRANIAAVLGELLTYVEHRERTFETLFSRTPIRVAERLIILATYNPVDRSALNIDDALLRRMRVIDFLPDPDQLEEMLAGRGIPNHVVAKLNAIFRACKTKHPDEYAASVPFGHGIFAEVRNEGDLHPLWKQRVERILFRPGSPHPFAETIKEAYPWHKGPDERLDPPVQPNAGEGAGAIGEADGNVAPES